MHDQLDYLRGFSHNSYLRNVLLADPLDGAYGLIHGWHDSLKLLVTFLPDFLSTLKVLMHQEFFLLELLAQELDFGKPCLDVRCCLDQG